jgi:hypothetical protein
MSLSGIRFVRLLRTAGSERFLAVGHDSEELAAVDLHYLPSGKVSGTVVILGDALAAEEQVSQLLEMLDDELLPDVSVAAGNVSFTVVRGTVIGSFVSEANDQAS